MKNFPEEVWYHPDGITNILSFSRMKKHFDISYEDDSFVIRKPNGAT